MRDHNFASLWRSLLFMPAHEERFVYRAHLRGADAIILDLEDSVPSMVKPAARASLQDRISFLHNHGTSVIVRVNRDLANCAADLSVGVTKGVCAVMLPKVSGPDHIALVAASMTELERRAGLATESVGLIPLIETPAALANLAPISTVSARTIALAFGGEDFSTECGFAPTFQNLFGPCQQLVLGSRAARLRAFGLPGSIAGFGDEAMFANLVEQAKSMGFDGSLCIHPKQVAIVNNAFSPSHAELAQAARIVAASDEGLSRNFGAIEIDGVMVDPPVVARARALLAIPQRNDA